MAAVLTGIAAGALVVGGPMLTTRLYRHQTRGTRGPKATAREE